MELPTILVRILLVIVGVALVGIIMLQQTKDGGGLAGLGGAGGGASGSVFGSKGASSSFFKITAVLAIAFAGLVILTVYVSNKEANAGHTLKEIEKQAQQTKIPTFGDKVDAKTDAKVDTKVDAKPAATKSEAKPVENTDKKPVTSEPANTKPAVKTTESKASEKPVDKVTVTDLPSTPANKSKDSGDTKTK